jgi:hypothetical protein
MAIGGFTGSDNALTLDRLQDLVASGELRFVSTASGGRGGQAGSSEVTSTRSAGPVSTFTAGPPYHDLEGPRGTTPTLRDLSAGTCRRDGR